MNKPPDRDSVGRAQVEIPASIFERVGALCLELPEVTVRADESRLWTRSTAWSFDIRRRSFCLLVASVCSTGGAVTTVAVRAETVEREALLASGEPYSAGDGGADRLRVAVSDATDWDEIGELVQESYRMIAPKKLSRLLDPTTEPTGSAEVSSGRPH